MSITRHDFLDVLAGLGAQGREDVAWAESLKEPVDADDFALETIFVICNSGMKHTVAGLIYNQIRLLLHEGKTVKGNILGKSGKAAAIDKIWTERARFYKEYMAAPDKVAYARTIPWIGGITCYHVAKNFGAQVAKPDVHLKRLADHEGITAQALCGRLALETGYRIATVDTVLWRACAKGVINSRTGEISVQGCTG
jgi:hypothetical protein